jgi:hypothetical protein
MKDFNFSQIANAKNNITQVGRDYIKTVQINFQAGNWMALAISLTPLLFSGWLGMQAVNVIAAAGAPKYAKCLNEEQPIQGQVPGNTIVCLGSNSSGKKHAFIRTLDSEGRGEKGYGISQDVSDFSIHTEGLGYNTQGFKFIQEERDRGQNLVNSSKCLYSLKRDWRFCDGNFNLERDNPNALPTLTGIRDVTEWVGFNRFSDMQSSAESAERAAKEAEINRAAKARYDAQPERCKNDSIWKVDHEGCPDNEGKIIHYNKKLQRIDENGNVIGN